MLTIVKILICNNQRLESVFSVTRLSLLCQVGDDVIRPCKICGGCQIRAPRSIHHSFIIYQSTLSHTILTPICIRSVVSNAISYLLLSYDQYSSTCIFITKLLRKFLHDSCTHYHKWGRKKPSHLPKTGTDLCSVI